MKSPVGAYNLRPLFFIFSYFLLFIFYCPRRPALPCPAPPLPCPVLTLPCPVSNFPFAARDRRGSYTRNGQCFFFLLLPGTGGGSYTGNSSSSPPPGTLLLLPRGRFCAFGFRDSWSWSQVQRFACGRDG